MSVFVVALIASTLSVAAFVPSFVSAQTAGATGDGLFSLAESVGPPQVAEAGAFDAKFTGDDPNLNGPDGQPYPWFPDSHPGTADTSAFCEVDATANGIQFVVGNGAFGPCGTDTGRGLNQNVPTQPGVTVSDQWVLDAYIIIPDGADSIDLSMTSAGDAGSMYGYAATSDDFTQMVFLGGDAGNSVNIQFNVPLPSAGSPCAASPAIAMRVYVHDAQRAISAQVRWNVDGGEANTGGAFAQIPAEFIGSTLSGGYQPALDANGDPAHLTADFDNDGVPDIEEMGFSNAGATLDTDNDGTPDCEDTDSDNDGSGDDVDPNRTVATAVADTATVAEDGTLTADVAANDVEFASGNNSVTDFGTGTATGATVSAAGVVSWDTEGIAPGDYTFDYEICNNDATPAGCGTASLTITVEAATESAGLEEDLAVWLRGNAGIASTTADGDLVTSWVSQSAGAQTFTAAADQEPSFLSSGLNFNPGVAFDASTHLSISGGVLDPNASHQLYTVLEYRSGSNVIWSQLVGGQGKLQIANGGYNNNSTAGATAPDFVAENTPRINTARQVDLEVETFFNGDTIGTGTHSAVGAITASNIGGGLPGGHDLNGEIYEFIAIANSNTAAGQLSIESYLALKYGITLDAGVGSYTNSASADVFVNAAFWNDIAGIGAEAASTLDQRVSKSENDDAIVTIATTADFTSSNLDAGRSSLGDGNFAVWGNDDGAATFSESGAPSGHEILDRTWTISETGTVGAVQLQVYVDDADFDLGEFTGDLHLVAGSDLSAATPIAMTDAGNGLWTIAHDFTNDDLFSFVFTDVPALAAPDLQAGDDSGLSATDNITFVVDAGYIGECSSNVAVLNLYSDNPAPGTLVGTHVCTSTLPQAITASPGLAEGVHNLTYTQTVGGVEGPFSPALEVTIDLTEPDAPTTALALQPSSDTGDSSTDRLTSDRQPTFDVECSAAGSVIKLYSDVYTTPVGAFGTGEQTGQAINFGGNTFLNFDGTFVAPFSGEYIFVRRAESVTRADGGSGSANGSLSIGTSAGASDVYVDTAQSVRLTTAILEQQNTVSLIGGVEYFVHAWAGGGGVVTNPSYEFRGTSSAIGFHTCEGAGTESATINLLELDEGVHNISYTQSDIAGNESAPGPAVDVTIGPDPTAPDAPAQAPDLQADSDNGAADNDNVTSTLTHTFDVRCTEHGSTITLLSDSPTANTTVATHECLLEPGGSETVSVVVAPGLSTGVHNISYTETNDIGTSEASPSVQVTALATGDIDISIDKTSTGDFATGADITYTIEVGNAGPGFASEVVVTDDFPTGISGITWTCATSSANSSCASPSGSGDIDETVSIASGDTVTFTATGTTSATVDTLTNEATATPLDRTIVGSFDNIGDTATSAFSSFISNEQKFDAQVILPDDWQNNALEVDFVRIVFDNRSTSDGLLGLNVGGNRSNIVEVVPGIQELVFHFPAGSVVSPQAGPNPVVDAGIGFNPLFPTSLDGTGQDNTIRGFGFFQTSNPDLPNEVESIGENEFQVEAQFRASPAPVSSSVTDGRLADAPTVAPDLQDDSDTGAANDDDLTNDTTPTFDVVCSAAGNTITLYSDSPNANTEIGTHTCGGAGVEAATASTALGGGVHNITYTETAGAESAPSPALAITIDVDGPDAPATAPDLQAGSDSGDADDDDLTSETSPTFDVVCTEAGSTITLLSDTAGVVGYHTCTGSGTEQATVASGPGAAGNWISETCFAQPATLNNGGNTRNVGPAFATLSFSHTASGNYVLTGFNGNYDGNGGGGSLDGYLVTNVTTGESSMTDGASWGGTFSQLTNNVFTLDMSIDVSTGDVLTFVPQNASGGSRLRFNFTNTSEVYQGLSGTGAAGSQLRVQLEGHGSVNIVREYDDGSLFTVDRETNTITPLASIPANWLTCDSQGIAFDPVEPLTDGEHNITFTETDAAGNESGESPALAVTIDTEGPTTAPTVDEPEDGETIASSTPTVSGSGGEAGGTIVVTGPGRASCTAPVASDGTWSCELDLALPEGGPATLTVTSVDPAGNEGAETTIETTVDTTAPATPTFTPDLLAASDTGTVDDDDLTSDTTPSFDVACTEAGHVITVYSDNPAVNTAIGTHTCAGAGTETATVGAPGLGDGVHNITFTETDAAGNESGASPALEIEIDSAGPTSAPVITEPGDGEPIATPTPTVAGTGGEPGGTVIVTGPNGEECVASVAADGSWSCTLAPGLPEGGPATITVTPVDESGNEGPAATISTTIDTTTPDAPTSAPDLQAGSDSGDADDDDLTSETTPSFDVACTEAGHVITVYSDNPVANTAIGTHTCASAGIETVTVTAPGLGDGVHNITITETDLAGNESDPSPSLEVGIDTAGQTTAPTITEPGDGETIATATPAVSGTGGEPGGTVVVTGPNGETCTAPVDENGDWSCELAPGLPEGGPATITVTPVDPAGNEGTSTTFESTIDTTAPSAPGAAPDLHAASDTGDATDDDLTSDTTPSFDVVCGEAGHVITIYSDNPAAGTAVGTHTCVGVGIETASVDAPGLDEGTHNVTFTETDAVGNESAPSPGLAIQIDSEGPATVPAIGEPEDGATVPTTTPTFTGTGGEPGGSVIVTGPNGEECVAPVAADGSWSCEIAPGLPEGGPSTITLTPIDPAGNEGTSSTIETTVDTTAPVAPTSAPDLAASSDTGVSDSDEVTADNTPTFNVECSEAGATITVLSDNPADGTIVGSHTCEGVGIESVTVDDPGLGEGVHNITFTETDPSGNESNPSPAISVAIDNTSPGAPTITSPTNGGQIGTNTPTVSGTGGVPGGTVTVTGPNGQECTAPVDANGEWFCTLSPELGEGEATITATSVDPSGNEGTATSISTTVDTNPSNNPLATPELDPASDTGVSNSDGITSDNTPTFIVGCSEAGETITMYSNGSPIGTHTCEGEGVESVTIDAPGLSDGAHDITYTSTLPGGEESAPSAALPITIDTTPPATPTVASPGEGEVVATTTPTFAGTGGEPGSTIVVTGPNGETCEAPVQPDGSWSCQLDPALPLGGPSTVTVTLVDPAGNTGTPTEVSITVDPTDPSAALPIADLDPASDTGVSNTDNVTSDTTPTFTVLCRGAGEVITLYSDTPANGTVIGAHTCEGVGTESASVDAPGLVDGTHGITYTTTPVGGVESEPSAALPVTIDATPPGTPTVSSPSNGATVNTTTPTFTGVGGPTGGTIVVSGPGGETCTAVVQPNGSWSCTLVPGLPEGGPSQITITPVEPAGNEGIPAIIQTNIDTTVPTPGQAPDLQPGSDTGVSDTDDITSNTTPTIDVVCSEPGATITLTSNNPAPGTVVGEHTCEFAGLESVTADEPGLADGEHQISYTETDALGNESAESASLALTIDTRGPETPVVGEPDDGSTIITPTPTVSGTGGEPGTSVIVTGPNGEECVAPVADDGSWSCTLDPALTGAGPHEITVTPVDASGNEGGPTTFEVTVDLDPDSDGDGVTDSEENSIRGGDGNGDGVADAEQSSVASVANLAGDGFHTLGSVGNTCTDITELALISENAANQDPNFSYPAGLFDFTIECENAGEAATATIYFDEEHDTAAWQWRKYDRNDNSYSNVAGVTFGTATVDGATVTTATFSIADGGLLDEDGTLNASITDPSGPGVAVVGEAPPALAFTGRTILATVLFGLMLVMAGLFLVTLRGRREDEEFAQTI